LYILGITSPAQEDERKGTKYNKEGKKWRDSGTIPTFQGSCSLNRENTTRNLDSYPIILIQTTDRMQDNKN